ncbi:MAG: type II toxin-antitoxin system HicB family antitoxin [Hyphomicrobiaceae bacterium]
MRTYYALVHKDAGSAYGITFPDLPGCFGASDAEGDISEAAQSALVLYAQDEARLPEPRTIPQLQADREIKRELAAGAILLAVPLIVVERKARYNVILDVDLVAGVDQKARTMGISRSEYLAASLIDRLSAHSKIAVSGGSRSMPSAASKVLTSRKASKGEKMVAASALAQTKSKDVTSKVVASAAAKVLKDPKASKDAKSAAASALTQAPAKKAAAKKK